MSIINEALKRAEAEKKQETKVSTKQNVFEPFRGVAVEEAPPVIKKKAPAPSFVPKKEISTLQKAKRKYNWLLPMLVILGMAAIVFRAIGPVYIPLDGIKPATKPFTKGEVSQKKSVWGAPLRSMQQKDAGVLDTVVSETSDGYAEGTAPLTYSRSPVSLSYQRPNFTLTGISNLGGFRSAIINSRVVEEGDTVDGAEVIAISARKVRMKIGNSLFSVHLQ